MQRPRRWIGTCILAPSWPCAEARIAAFDDDAGISVTSELASDTVESAWLSAEWPAAAAGPDGAEPAEAEAFTAAEGRGLG